MAYSNAKLFTPRKVCWANDYVNTLGIDISNNSFHVEGNVKSVILKMRAVAQMWNMTLTGRVLIINNLMSSLFIYKLQILPVFSEDLVVEIENIFHDFLWKGKHEKIVLDTLYKNKEDGGLGLVNIKVTHQALLCNWATECFNIHPIMNLASTLLDPKVKEKWFWSLNLTRKDAEHIFPGTSFWHNLLYLWCVYTYRCTVEEADIGTQVLHANSHI